MYIPKRYGQSKIESCPFCGNRALSTNKQGVPVCHAHKDKLLPDMKCLCGEYLDMKKGKYGPFFVCMNCGTMNLRKALELNPIKKEKTNTKDQKAESKKDESDLKKSGSSGIFGDYQQKKTFQVPYKKNGKAPKNRKPKEMVIRSDDPLYF